MRVSMSVFTFNFFSISFIRLENVYIYENPKEEEEEEEKEEKKTCHFILFRYLYN